MTPLAMMKTSRFSTRELRDRNGELIANGGRVLNITASGKTVQEAQKAAYAAIAKIDWPEGFYRHDIGWRAIEREKAL